MAAAEGQDRLLPDAEPAALRRPVAPLEGLPLAEHQRGVRGEVGQPQQRRRGQALLPARVDQLDRHRHRIDQGGSAVEIERVRECRVDIAAQAQRDLRFDQPAVHGPARGVGAARPHAGRWQRGMGERLASPGAAGLPVARRAVAEPAERLRHPLLHRVRRVGIGQRIGQKRGVGGDAAAASLQQRLGDGIDAGFAHAASPVRSPACRRRNMPQPSMVSTTSPSWLSTCQRERTRPTSGRLPIGRASSTSSRTRRVSPG